MYPARRALASISAMMVSWSALGAQQNPDARVTRVEIRPGEITVSVGERVPVEVVALDADGQVVDGAFIQAWTDGAAASFDFHTLEIEGKVAGTAAFVGRVRRPAPNGPGFENFYGRAKVTVLPRPVERIDLAGSPTRLLAGTRSRLMAQAYSAAGPRDDARVSWSSSNPAVVTVAAGGAVQARTPGEATITASAGSVSRDMRLVVLPNTVAQIIVSAVPAARVGDVVRLTASVRDSSGLVVPDAEVTWSHESLENQGADAGYLETEDDTSAIFVPYAEGLHRLTASVGGLAVDVSFEASSREPRREVRLVAHGVAPTGHATTDLWVFRGNDDRDYVYTGTYAGNLLYVWDVTDAANPTITDSLAFDGRRVNDVKVNDEATLAVVTSENAANRRNGITVLGLADPAHPERLSHFTEGMTGGVHNTWIEGDLVYAINYGTHDVRIVDISDPASPRMAGHWGIANEDRYLHDVMVEDGLAYLSYWDDGLVILDVGRGIKGGTPTNPQLVSQYRYRYRIGDSWYGNTHHAVRYGDYVFVGDEIFGCSECINGPRGYIHVVDVSDLDNPREVAHYRVPEAGVHNMWAEDGKLYIGYYQAGLRVLDITGELRGDLYRQSREVGWYMTQDSAGTVPNSTDTWGAQPYGGRIYASDSNSGLWIVELAQPEPAVP